MISPTYNARLRAKDDLILRWVELRASGMTCPAIAARFGVTAGYVRVSTWGVMSDDLSLSDEPEHSIRAHYWQED